MLRSHSLEGAAPGVPHEHVLLASTLGYPRCGRAVEGLSPTSCSLGGKGHGLISDWALAILREGGSNEGRVPRKMIWTHEEGQRQNPAGRVHLSLTSVVTLRPVGTREESADSLGRPGIIESWATPWRGNCGLREVFLPATRPVSLPGLHEHTDNVHISVPDSTSQQAVSPRPPLPAPPNLATGKATIKADIIVGQIVWLCLYSNLFVQPKGALC